MHAPSPIASSISRCRLVGFVPFAISLVSYNTSSLIDVTLEGLYVLDRFLGRVIHNSQMSVCL